MMLSRSLLVSRRIIVNSSRSCRFVGAMARSLDSTSTSASHRLLQSVHQVGRWSSRDTHHNGSPSAYATVWDKIVQEDDDIRNTISYCLSFSNDQRDFDRNLAQLDDLMLGQLTYCQKNNNNNGRRSPRRCQQNSSNHHHHQHRPAAAAAAAPTVVVEHYDTKPLPTSWDEALTIQHSRAIVITETTRPFNIVHVNAAWEQMCGYNRREAHGKSLGSLLHGTETDVANITSMLHPLLVLQPDENVVTETGTVVTNYTKSGRRFRNRVRIGPLYQNDDSDAATASAATTTSRYPTHFIGVLQEIHDGM